MKTIITTLIVLLTMGLFSFAWSAETSIDFGLNNEISSESINTEVNYRNYDFDSVASYQTESPHNMLDNSTTDKALKAAESHQYSLGTTAETLSGEAVRSNALEGNSYCINC